MPLLCYTIRAWNYYHNIIRSIHGRAIVNCFLFSLMSDFDKWNFAPNITTLVLLKFRVLNFVIFSSSFLQRLWFVLSWLYACFLSDIDEYKEGHGIKMNKCHPNASYIKTQGSYHCSCNPSYVGNGFECRGTFSTLQTF